MNCHVLNKTVIFFSDLQLENEQVSSGTVAMLRVQHSVLSHAKGHQSWITGLAQTAPPLQYRHKPSSNKPHCKTKEEVLPLGNIRDTGQSACIHPSIPALLHPLLAQHHALGSHSSAVLSEQWELSLERRFVS